MQPRKVRIIAAEVRGKSATHAVHLLRYHSSKGARELRKVLMSAIANAQENNNLSPDTLQIAAIVIDEGPRLKRLRARAMGRANRIIKKSSHITVVVKDVEPSALVKSHGTKAKARPKFGAPPKGKKAKIEAPAAATIVEETPSVEAVDSASEEVLAVDSEVGTADTPDSGEALAADSSSEGETDQPTGTLNEDSSALKEDSSGTEDEDETKEQK